MLRYFDAGHAALGQRVAHPAGLRVRAHQHGNIAWRQRASFQQDLAGRAADHQPCNLTGGRCCGPIARGMGCQDTLVLVRQHPYLQVGVGTGGVAERHALFLAELYRVIVQPGQHERLRVGAEQFVEGGDQTCRRALVAAQRGRGLHHLPGLQVGMQVGIAEAVDGLLGVADQEQRCIGAMVDAAENRKLQRIGVLEFVNQRDRITGAQRIRQPGCCAIGQRGVQVA